MLPRSQNSTIPATVLLLLSPLAIPSGPFSYHAFCPSLLQHIVTLKRHKELPWRLTKRHARESGPQSYIYIMQVIRSLSFSGMDFCVSAAYNWHYVLRASPNSRTPYAPGHGNQNRKKSKQRYASSALANPQ
jgi:hypothetical protein